MSGEANYLDISLLGKEYRVACPPEEHEALLAAVAYVDEKMRDIAEKTKSNIAERIAVMAALNIAHEYLARENQAGAAPDAQALTGSPAGSQTGLDFGAVKRRISAMEAQLDAALAPQEEQLF